MSGVTYLVANKIHIRRSRNDMATIGSGDITGGLVEFHSHLSNLRDRRKVVFSSHHAPILITNQGLNRKINIV